MMRPLIVPGIIAAFSVVIIYLALQLKLSPPMIVGHSMQPRSFPIFLMVINLILVAILAWDCMRNPPKPIKLEGITTWVSISMFAAFYFLTTYADFFIAIAVVMFVLSTSWGEKRLHIAALVSVTVPLTLFLLFDEVLKIRFPRGLITNWYYG
ncbi:MAG: tripartite tricarboxylate transporter TctB family protein [Pseudomonadota bacterium]|nr:tripartite tricarboxylate transporter TctB family protein [Pseudomonadota bacterium]MEC8672644.1 tripartite tricarboxylate transporter TctB family protein [Pseudomonadota bacterium]